MIMETKLYILKTNDEAEGYKGILLQKNFKLSEILFLALWDIFE